MSGCLQKSEKKRSYYYSDEDLDNHKVEGTLLVDIANIDSVRAFIAGRCFISKTYKIKFDNDLKMEVSNNGKLLYHGTCEIGEFMINEERLLLFMDDDGQEKRMTLSHSGMLTDKSTYALYKRCSD